MLQFINVFNYNNKRNKKSVFMILEITRNTGIPVLDESIIF